MFTRPTDRTTDSVVSGIVHSSINLPASDLPGEIANHTGRKTRKLHKKALDPADIWSRVTIHPAAIYTSR